MKTGMYNFRIVPDNKQSPLVKMSRGWLFQLSRKWGKLQRFLFSLYKVKKIIIKTTESLTVTLPSNFQRKLSVLI